MREKVLILGLSNSGIAAAECAVNKGYDVYITESKSIGDIREEYRSRLEDLKSKGIKTEIRSILQRGYFVLPDYGAVRSGLKQIDNILKRLKGGSFAITTEFSEVLSMATAAHIILSEVDEK